MEGVVMKIFFHSERCCATCEHWLGPRNEVERGCVHAVNDFSGLCLDSGKDADTTGACARWVLWRPDGLAGVEQKAGGWESLRLNG